jgi:hypothetical protein
MREIRIRIDRKIDRYKEMERDGDREGQRERGREREGKRERGRERGVEREGKTLESDRKCIASMIKKHPHRGRLGGLPRLFAIQ